jgi:predicted ATPase
MTWEAVSVGGRMTSRVVVGRAAERASLDAAFRSASAGAPVRVLVAGEAGIGKTRLVAEFAHDVAAEAIVLAGGCIDERVPYSPVADALRSLARSGWHADADIGWGELGALVPELAGQANGGESETGSSGRLHSAFVRLLEHGISRFSRMEVPYMHRLSDRARPTSNSRYRCWRCCLPLP